MNLMHVKVVETGPNPDGEYMNYELRITGKAQHSRTRQLSAIVKSNLIRYAFEAGRFDFDIPEAYLLWEFESPEDKPFEFVS